MGFYCDEHNALPESEGGTPILAFSLYSLPLDGMRRALSDPFVQSLKLAEPEIERKRFRWRDLSHNNPHRHAVENIKSLDVQKDMTFSFPETGVSTAGITSGRSSQ